MNISVKSVAVFGATGQTGLGVIHAIDNGIFNRQYSYTFFIIPNNLFANGAIFIIIKLNKSWTKPNLPH